MMSQEIRLVFMGVCGCGKTTLAARTAAYLGCERVIEADEFHTPEMKQKMGAGIPLTDEDRWPWLERLNAAMKEMRSPWSVITCSALRQVYREKLAEGLGESSDSSVRFIFLDAPKEIIKERMMRRQHEYMPVSLLDSQFETLEVPTSDEPVIRISVTGSEDETFEQITHVIEQLQRSPTKAS
jgi:carbohydrate kinase (thermoresistant glucokinase family)